jgi:hypothetical protein
VDVNNIENNENKHLHSVYLPFTFPKKNSDIFHKQNGALVSCVTHIKHRNKYWCYDDKLPSL